jgi:hypothetical protein
VPYNAALPLLGIYLKEFDSGYYKSTCTPMFIAALFFCVFKSRFFMGEKTLY